MKPDKSPPQRPIVQTGAVSVSPIVDSVRLRDAVTFPGGAVLGSLHSGADSSSASKNGGFVLELSAHGVTASKDGTRVLVPWANVVSVVLK